MLETNELFQKYDSIPLEELVDYVILKRRWLTEPLLRKLRANLSLDADVENAPLTIAGSARTLEEVDLAGEVAAQIRVLQTLRRNVVDGNKLIASPRDAKEMLTASTQLLSLLTKMQEDIWGMHRVRKIQQATLEALEGVDPNLVDEFMANLQKRLKE
jgi:hypothetical protein